MKQFNFDIAYIAPFTHKMIPIQIMHGHHVLYDHLVMPWETGISKRVSFYVSNADFDFDVKKLKVINQINKMPITLESVILNDTIHNITTHLPQHQKQVYLDTFFKACNVEATVFKITGLPGTFSLSHSYICNGHLYVPKCDRYNSILSFHQDNSDFKFSIECFHAHIPDCLYHLECHYNRNNIATKVIRPNPQNIQDLHVYLKENYQETITEECFDDKDTDLQATG
ncbi:MAG: hypothetical protein ACJARD_000930 [Alphaproteobacteria bacterium]|jgi:hypothetical protein